MVSWKSAGARCIVVLTECLLCRSSLGPAVLDLVLALHLRPVDIAKVRGGLLCYSFLSFIGLIWTFMRLALFRLPRENIITGYLSLSLFSINSLILLD